MPRSIDHDALPTTADEARQLYISMLKDMALVLPHCRCGGERGADEGKTGGDRRGITLLAL